MTMHSPAIIAITKQGIAIARKIKENISDADIYVPAKYDDSKKDIIWFKEQTGDIVALLFKKYDALICIFSLGAVIRLIAPVVVNKKSDPAVLVIDDKANFVISALSGHLGGANELARKVSSFFPDSRPVITTAADVNETIAVDLIGREFGWEIEFDQNVTRVSALMVNEVKVPNPSEMVLRYEGTASVSEASALLASQGNLVIPKQKFPPDLTVAVARKSY